MTAAGWGQMDSVEVGRERGGLTALGVRERGQGREEARDGRAAHDRPVREERVDGDGALAHVHETLRHSNHEQAVWLLVVVTRELAEHLRQTCVVGAGADETHCEDGVERNGEVVVVGVFGECVHYWELRVGGGDEAQCERHCSAQDGLAVVHL